MKNNWFLLVALLLVFAGCRKDKDEIVIENEQMDPPLTVEMVNSNLVGTVVNEAGDAIEGAVVRLGNLQKLTDENGIFTFQNATVDGNGAYIQVEALGYFPGSRT
ncbi:MAG: carboxypeptidase-like regulatory domain-containing protein, partial [Bacteroidota bacterium]